MWPYLPELLDRPVPRYTSYPTAAEFDAVEQGFHESGFDALAPAAAISLYVHIPFCEKICWYCGCNTGAANRAHRLTAYLDALHSEIETVSDRLGNQRPVTQIAFGGGSPNAIEPVDFVRLLDHLSIAFDAFGTRLSTELDPRSLTEEWMAVLGRAGFSHASLGVQTFDPHLQARIGRIQPTDRIKRAVDGLRANGVSSLNFDLMYGLPGQSCAMLAETLDQAIALRPDRIALFGYAHLPAMIKRQQRIDDSDMPDAKQRFDMAALGFELLASAGYIPIGFDHFGLPGDSLTQAYEAGDMRRNFQGFTDDPCDALIGLGASAISSFPDRLVQNEKNSGRYRMLASAHKLTAERGIVRSAADRRHGAVIESLLCRGEADISGLDLAGPMRSDFRRLQRLGLVEIDGDLIRMTADGRPYGRTIASRFDAYRAPKEKRFSSAI
ncbi:oxygen-independent coproporphyrinogen III oxidase [Parasphingopyxis sp.]|uniref:oxygen-independent coproporphyrinogen III oxidase n=1 Tax=Parasphingopyxis sp. TaxID=1920299 RepID=UPI002618DB06|nr:oxygen-independent coproporphyrinogen III oxidase [Parasphingopyxis sp.]